MFRSRLANERTPVQAVLLAAALVGAFSWAPSSTLADGEQSLEAGDAVAVVLHAVDSATAEDGVGGPTLIPLPLTPPEVVIPASVTRAYRTADLDNNAPRLKSQHRPLKWL